MTGRYRAVTGVGQFAPTMLEMASNLRRLPSASRLRGVSPAEQRESLIAVFSEAAAADVDEWIGAFASLTEQAAVSERTARSALGRLAWMSRERGAPLPQQFDPPDHLGLRPSLLRCWFVGERLRYDYRFRDMFVAAVGWRRRHPDDGLLIAFEAFARLGLQDEQGIELFKAALAAPDVDDRVEYVCLAGMWFATELAGQAELLLDLANRMIADGKAHHVLFYRRAGALRRLGRFREALEDIDRAIAGLDPVDGSFLEVHQDYVRERELIVTCRLLSERSDSLLADMKTQLDEAIGQGLSAAQASISESLLKLVEILGLFVTLAGFVAATGGVLLKATSWRETALSVALATAGSLAFFVLLRVVVRGGRRRG